MSALAEVDAAKGRLKVLAFLLVGSFLVKSTLPTRTAYGYIEYFCGAFESVVLLVSPAQWMVALLGLCLYPALNRTGRSVDNSGVLGSSVPCTSEPSRRCGPGSHSIQLDQTNEYQYQTRGALNGLFKRLRRVLSEGRAHARQICGRHGPLHSAVSSFSRRRSFGSRSSKSEDVLSSRLSADSRAAQQNASGGGVSGRRGLLQRRAYGGASGGDGGSGSRWQPSMSRIASGQHFADVAPSTSSISSVAGGKRLEILSYNGFQAVDCLSHEMTDPAFASVRQVVTDTHLLQFGAMIGEASAQLALSQAGSPGPVGPEPASVFGPYDRPELYRQGWELVAEEHKPGLHYWNWRRHLRKGLYMYKSKTVYETATTAQYKDFTYDMEFRRTWDESVVHQLPIPPPPPPPGDAGGVKMTLAEAGAKAAGGRSVFMYARTKFPPPMASRDYTYARRCWAKPDDGGCYCISRACVHPSPPQTGGRAVRVHDMISGYVIRSSKGIFDPAHPAVELVSVYFEDPAMSAGIANMGIRRALWPMVQKTEAAFRDFLLTRVHGSLEQPPPPHTLAVMDAFGAALGPEAAHVARTAAADADAASCLGGLPAGGCSRRWTLASPYVLAYRGYMAAWQGGRAALLSALSSCMSLWCNVTGLCVSAWSLGGRGIGAVAVAARALLSSVSGSPRAGTASGVLARLLWPWEALARGGWGRVVESGEAIGRGKKSMPPSSASSGSGSGGRLSSHPLCSSGGSAQGPKRLCFAPAPVTGTAGGSVPDGSSRRVRGGMGRRCAVLAVKLARLAGAGLLLGRAARADGASRGPEAGSGEVGAAYQQSARRGQVTEEQQQRSRRALLGLGRG